MLKRRLLRESFTSGGRRMTAFIKADRDKCIGAGLCTVAAKHFDIDATGKVDVLVEGPVEIGDLDMVADAVAICPAEAIWLEDVEDAARV